MTRWPSYLMLGAGVALMQAHAAQAWFAWVGWFAVAWSPALEGAALYGWWKSSKGLAWSASILLVLGALYTLSGETVDGMARAYTNTQQVADTRDEIAQLATSLLRYDENSTEKLGWAGRIDRTQEKLDAARDRLRTLQAAPEAGRIWWRDVAVILYQTLALLAVMVAQIQAVIALREKPKQRPSPSQAMKASRPPPAAPARMAMAAATPVPHASGDFDHRVAHVAELVAAAKHADESWADVARRLGVRPADISMLRNHADRRNASKETISAAALGRIASHFDKKND